MGYVHCQLPALNYKLHWRFAEQKLPLAPESLMFSLPLYGTAYHSANAVLLSKNFCAKTKKRLFISCMGIFYLTYFL